MNEKRTHAGHVSRGEFLLIFAFWTFMAVLSALGASLDPRGRMLQPGPLPGHVVLPFVQYYLWALLTPVIFWLASYVGLEHTQRVGRILVLLAAGVLLAMVVDVAFFYLRFELFAPPPRPRRAFGNPPGPFLGLRRFWFLDDFALYLAVLGAGLARDYSLRLRARHDEAVLLQAETARLNAQLAEARLAALRTQLDPHFLFNTLNAVSALVERDPRGVRRMIARLSQLLRTSLERASTAEVPLRDELAFIEQYLEIMQIRFQGRLEIDVQASANVLDALVPPLILQPLVENAIKHGTGNGERIARIEISAAREADELALRVRDHGSGPQQPIVEGVGLRNTRERLNALYGDAQRLDVVRAPDGGAHAELRVPYHTNADLRANGVADEEAYGPETARPDRRR